jgi:single-stranded-DNA-specific exonuclease
MEPQGLLSRWRPRSAAPADSTQSGQLARELHVSPLLATLLLQRGQNNPSDARKFLKPSLTDLHDPALLPGTVQAAKRLSRAVHDHEPIVIYSDYDVDGITAGAILWHVLKLAGAQATIYTPHRIDEGYGLNTHAIQNIAQNKPLIISVDCGITATEPARAAKTAGVDLIITDHHQFDPDHLPQAHTLVHPALPDSLYPFKDLCGAGVAFKVAWQFARTHFGSERVPDEFRALLLDLLTLAALGTVADVVPLRDENRVITSHGLGQIKRTRFVGLNAMIDAANLRDEKITAEHVGFVLGPRLNAAGRMGHAADATHLLTDADPPESMKIARFLTSQNQLRQATELRVFDHAARLISDSGLDNPDQRAIVLSHQDWHPGVLGIVASRLVEKFTRPVVLLNLQDNQAHGSARSVHGLSIHEAFAACAHLLTSYGGHAMAAGLRLPAENLDRFREELVQFVNHRLPPEDLTRTIQIDTVCQLADTDITVFAQIHQMAPFGHGNPTPVLCVEHASLATTPQRVGADGKHLKLTVHQGDRSASGIGFGMGHLADQLTSTQTLDVAFEPRVSTWQNQRRPELHVKDLRPT